MDGQDAVLARLRDRTLRVDCSVPTILSITRRGKLVTQLQPFMARGYLRCSIWYKRRRYTLGVHAIVMLATIRRRIDEGWEVHHIDRDPLNNRGRNLALRSIAGNRQNSTSFTAEPGFPWEVDSWWDFCYG